MLRNIHSLSNGRPKKAMMVGLVVLKVLYWAWRPPSEQLVTCPKSNKSCRRTASSPAGYILYCNIFIIKPYNIGHTDLDVFVCKSFCHIDIIIQV